MGHLLCFTPCPSSFLPLLLPGPQHQPRRQPQGIHLSLQHRQEGELQPTQVLTLKPTDDLRSAALLILFHQSLQLFPPAHPPLQSCWLSSTTSLLAESSAALMAGLMQAALPGLPCKAGSKGVLSCQPAPPIVPSLPTHALLAQAQLCTLGTPGTRVGWEMLPDVSDWCTSAWKVPGRGGGVRQQHYAMVARQQGPRLCGDVAPVSRADATAAMVT